MSIHKLTAGSGYDYLTRQVAALDATEKGHVPLASYYTERGETPGVWIGSGLAGIDGLQAGDPVTAEQMQALFGVGLHPLAVQRQQQLEGPDLTSRDYQLVTRLGAPFKIYDNDIPPFRVEVARRIAELNAVAGLSRDWPVPRSERARVRTEVASEHQTWGPYLAARAATIAELADRVRDSAGTDQLPRWAGQDGRHPPSRVVQDVEVWRAATGVSPDDQRPTGPVQRHKTARIWQRQLDNKLGSLMPAWQEWAPLIGQIGPSVRNDSFAPILAGRLAAISRAGVNATQLLRTAVLGEPLPDDHAAAALWWRICRHLPPGLSAQVNRNATFTKPWKSRLAEHVGAERAEILHASPWWPALVTAVDQGLQRGWRLENLLRATTSGPAGPDVDQCQAMVWRISVALDPLPDDEPHESNPSSTSPDLLHANAPTDDENATATTFEEEPAVTPSTEITLAEGKVDQGWLEPDLAVAAMLRDIAGPPEPTDADVTRMFTRAITWRECPVSRERMLEINELSLAYLRRHFPSSWGQKYLADRFGEDITNDPRFQPGQAPAGWTNLVDHLRQHGVTDEEMITTGVATMASTGRLIDRFRDRVVFPIIHNGEVLGFIGRRHPDISDLDRAAPKYLNTPETPLYHKGAQLFGVLQDQSSAGAIPVIVEGPMDAIAVTLASRGLYLGVAPLGTSLTEEQASQLARLAVQPVVATDADPAGRMAAERAFWMLSCYRLDPLYARLLDGTDPADLLALRGPTALTKALAATQPLAERLLEERLANLPPAEALLEAARVVAARPSRRWDQDSSAISFRLGVPMAQVRHTLLTLVKQWNSDPRRAAQQPLQTIGEVKHRISTATASPAEQRRTPPPATLTPEHFRRAGPARRQSQQDDQLGCSRSTLTTGTNTYVTTELHHDRARANAHAATFASPRVPSRQLILG
jgi:DNA primase catalytic core